ncbi:HTH_48 domain-containing protein [Nephila pilipes]|uniref:HTH_48 domain-containing protein n=1 Tax=Nephila pilipes TaxID=299642 RepID=A0A8X6PJ83_NEPPI|nr:HTH_48 domain-containing protein [Nephila pilipes]
MELNREHFRAIIFHNFRRGLSRQECFDELNFLYSDKAPSYSTVKNWYNEFNRGRCSIQGESRAGRPKSVVVPEKINAVRELIKQDRHVTYREIEASLDISMTSINKILHDYLSVKKICSRWIPHNLTNAQKKARVDWCKEMLEKYIQGTSKAVYNIYTGDESWIYAYEPETKQQSTVWVFQDEAKPTKVVRGRSTSKQMIACFFGINGHVATVALEQRRTVNSEWYTTICLPEVIGEIRKKQKNRRIILHHDNASSHTSTQTKAFLTERKIELMGSSFLTMKTSKGLCLKSRHNASEMGKMNSASDNHRLCLIMEFPMKKHVPQKVICRWRKGRGNRRPQEECLSRGNPRSTVKERFSPPLSKVWGILCIIT